MPLTRIGQTTIVSLAMAASWFVVDKVGMDLLPKPSRAWAVALTVVAVGVLAGAS